MNADFIYAALQKKHKLPEWVLFRELALGTGWDEGVWNEETGEYVWKGYQRRIDAWAINCYKSQHFRRIAYEIKCARSDFIAERRSPDKRRPAKAVSNHFYFAAPLGLIDPSEVPEDCGLLVVYESGKTRIVKRAPKLDAWRLDWRFVASLVRNLANAQRRDLPGDRFAWEKGTLIDDH